ncbi:MAG: MFS transporter [candidate division KSB1 bacterium]|nr:MFS transporter [candidate division KSB1 bacterium]
MELTATVSSNSLLRNRNLQVIFLVTLMAVLGVSSLTPVLPKIAAELHVPLSSIGLLITMFTLPGTVLTPIWGVAADRLGRKSVLIPALVLFGLAGAACFWARTFRSLLYLRFFQGIGAAALGALNVTIIGDLFSGRERIAAMGYNASVLSIATAAYPFLGGLLSSFAWRLPLLLPLLALPIALAAAFRLESPKQVSSDNFSAYLHGAVKGIANRQALFYFFCALFVFILLYGPYLTFLPILLSQRFQAEPFKIGLLFSGMSISNAITSSQTGRLAARFTEKKLLTFSFLFYAAALFIIPFLPSFKWIILPIVVYGIAQGLGLPSLQTLLTAAAPFEYRAAFMSLYGTVLRIGQTLGPVLAGLSYSAGGIRMPFWCGAVCAAAVFIVLVLSKKPKIPLWRKTG